MYHDGVSRPLGYIATDLVLVMRKLDQELLSCLDGKLSYLYVHRFGGWWRATCQSVRQYSSPVRSIESILSALESLDADRRQRLAACNVTFDTGLDASVEERYQVCKLPAPLVSRIARAGASIAFTVYGPAMAYGSSGQLSSGDTE